MNLTRDLHLCGGCKKIFSDLNVFLEHKSQCSTQNMIVFSPNPNDISFESGLFSNETVLDLTVLDSGSFLPILHCENEEVVSDASEIHPCQEIFHESSKDGLEKITPDKHENKFNEKIAANDPASHESLHDEALTCETEKSSKTGSSLVKKYQQEENGSEKDAARQSKKNICKICNYISPYHKDLIRHMRKHTGERPFSCSICDKKFARQDKLSTHKRIHVGDKRFKCQLCDYATTDSGALKKHSRIHTDDRPHRCQMCSYRARNASHMTVHLRTHTGDSPFFCKFANCEKSFKTSTDLKRHLKVHKLKPLSPSYSSFDGECGKYSYNSVKRNGKLFIKSPNCCICCQDSMHKDVIKKKQKMNRKEGNLVLCFKPHKCSICPASFVRQDSLRSHMKMHNLHTNPSQDVTDTEDDKFPSLLPETDTPSASHLTNSRLRDTSNIDTSFM